MPALALLIAAAAVPVPSEVREFGNWAVACDNGWRCEAVWLSPDEGRDFARFSMKVTREAGHRGEVSVRIECGPIERARGLVAVLVDGWTLARGVLDSNDGITFSGETASRLVAAMTNGRTLTLSLGNDAVPMSLKGSAATWRYMDDRQHRVGTVSALAARGDAPAASVRAAPPLPVVHAIRIRGQVKSFEGRFRKEMLGRADCLPEDDETAWSTLETLDSTTQLVSIRCSAGSYNSFHMVWLRRNGRLSTPRFDYMAEQIVERGGVGMYPFIDEEAGTLTNTFRFRGMGDCSRYETYAWDGARFRLIEAGAQHSCRGTGFTPTTWRARVAWRRG